MCGDHYDDLVQVGSVGLINAIDRFNPKQNTNFQTYASHLIAGEMKHYLRDIVPLVRPPRELQELKSKIKKISQELSNKLKRSPTSDEIAENLDISVEKVKQVLELEKVMSYISLDQDVSNIGDNEQDLFLIDQIEDKKYQSFHLIKEEELLVSEALKKIKFQSQQVIEFAFYQDLTQTEIAKKLGISQMQVSRRLKAALHEMWKILNTKVTPW